MPPKKKTQAKKDANKARSQSQSVQSDDDSTLCKTCQTLLVDTSECIECERCCKWLCLDCAHLTQDDYNLIQSRKFMHWFCAECEEPAIKAAQDDNLVEDKCREFLSEYAKRLDICEKKVELKADKSEVDKLSAYTKTLEDKIKGFQQDISKLNRNLNLVRFEPAEKIKRKNNIVIRGLPELDNKDEDTALISLALAEIDCADIQPSDIRRLGDKNVRPFTSSNESDEEDEQKVGAQAAPPRILARPVRCILNSVEEKAKILKKCKKNQIFQIRQI